MPVVRVCNYCKTAKIWSTYGLIHHIEKCHPEVANQRRPISIHC